MMNNFLHADFYQKDSMLMEFADLKDRKGKKIRFGDILIDSMGNFLTPVVEKSTDEHILFFKPLQRLNLNVPMGCKSSYSHTLLIIGNVFEDMEIQKLAINFISK